MSKRTKKQVKAILGVRREVADRVETCKTAKEKGEYYVERKKLEEFDERQRDLRRQPLWREFAEKHGIKPENLLIGPMLDETEAEEKGTAWLKRVIEVREGLKVEEGAEPVNNVHWNEDGTVTITINPEITRDVIKCAIDEVLDEGKVPPKKFNGQSFIKALEEGEKIYNEVAAGKTLCRIAKERCGIDENPAYNERVNTEYQKVKRYYEKFKKVKG